MADIKINVKTEGANSITNIKKEIKELRSQALAIGEGGAGFKELTRQANELQDSLDDLKDASKSLQGTGIEKLNASFGLLTDSFKNADFGKAKTAFTGLGTAMKAVPIFLLLEGINFILEKFEVFSKVTEFLTSLMYKFTDALGFTSKAAEEKTRTTVEGLDKEKKAVEERYDSEIKLAQAAGKEVNYLEQEKLTILEENTKKQIDTYRAIVAEKGKLNKEEQEKYDALQSELLKLSTDRMAKELEAEKKFQKEVYDYRNLQTTIAEDLAVAKMSDRQREIYLIKKKAQDRLKELDEKEVFNFQASGKQIEAQLKANAETRKQIEELAAIEVSKVNKKYAKEAVVINKAFNTQIVEDNEETHDRELAALIKIETDKKEAKAKADAEKLNLSAQAYSQEDKLQKDSLARQEAEAEAAFKKKVSNVNNYTQAIGSALNSIVGAFQAYSDLQRQNEEQDTKERQEALDTQLTALNATRDAELEKEGLTAEQKKAINYKFAMQEYELKLAEYNKNTEIKKKAFEQDKKLKIAQTVIATITGAVAAFTGSLQSIPAPYGLIVGALSAAAVTAMGAIQVAQISKQKFDAGSPPQAPTLAPPSTSGVGGDNQPGPQAGPDLYRINGDTNTGGGQGQRRAGGGNEPIKAYVVSQEVTTSQNMNNVIERRSSF